MDILPQLLLNALIAGSIYALTSSGLSLVYGLMKILNFSHGHMMMLGAYLLFCALNIIEINLSFGLVFVVCLTFIISYVSLHIFILPFLRYSFAVTLVTTLALSTILESSVSMIFGVNVKSLNTDFSIVSYEFFGMYITPIQIIIIASAIIVLFLLAFVIHGTPLGRKIRALSENSYAGESIGISKQSVIYIVYILGTMLAAFAGILVAYETNMQPTMGNAYTIKAFAAMILGGLGNLWGTIAGSYILGLIENLSIGLDFGEYSLPAGYKDAFSFLIILLVLLFKPQGLFNKKSREI